jgi:hypothetical protein
MMLKGIPTPSANFLKKQRRFKTLITGPLTGEEREERREERRQVGQFLQSEFAKAFELDVDTGKAADRFYHRNEKLFSIDSFDFEHRSFYRRGYNLVVVAQPYGLYGPEFKNWARGAGALGTIASEWGHWNPGTAGLILAEFTPEAKVAIDQMRKSS